jgi:hypothetical protein
MHSKEGRVVISRKLTRKARASAQADDFSGHPGERALPGVQISTLQISTQQISTVSAASELDREQPGGVAHRPLSGQHPASC